MWICAAGDLTRVFVGVVDFANMSLFWSGFNSFPSGNGPFSPCPDELNSPRVYFLDVRAVSLVVNPCAV
jgi:hypothetical protein